MKTSELKGAALDWAVSQIEHPEHFVRDWHTYSESWEKAGPIIEREDISIERWHGAKTFRWRSKTKEDVSGTGETPLIAAMRCYVASKLGDEITIPEELIWA